MRGSNFKLQRIRVPDSKTKSTAVHVTAFARRCSDCSVIIACFKVERHALVQEAEKFSSLTGRQYVTSAV